MNAIRLSLIKDAYGQPIDAIIYTTKSSGELKNFINEYFDIATNKILHGYNGNIHKLYDILLYLKEKYNYTDNDLLVKEPETIIYFY